MKIEEVMKGLIERCRARVCELHDHVGRVEPEVEHIHNCLDNLISTAQELKEHADKLFMQAYMKSVPAPPPMTDEQARVEIEKIAAKANAPVETTQ